MDLIKFEYNSLDKSTSDYLKEKEDKIKNIVEKSATDLGREFKEAQDKLSGSNQYNGLFLKWIESMGFKRDTVNKLINRYNLVVFNKDDQELVSHIESLPLSLSYEVSRPSAPKELKEKVFSGEITTHKEYVELKKKLEDTRLKLLERDNQIESKERTIKGLMSRPPETIEVESPKLLEALEDSNTQIHSLNAKLLRYEQQLKELKHLESEKGEILRVKQELENLKEKKSNVLKEYNQLTEIYKYINKAKKFIKEEMLHIPIFTNVSRVPDTAKAEIKMIIGLHQDWMYALKEKFQIGD